MKKKRGKTHFPFTDDFILLIHIQVQNQLTSYIVVNHQDQKIVFHSIKFIASIYICILVVPQKKKVNHVIHQTGGVDVTNSVFITTLNFFRTYIFFIYITSGFCLADKNIFHFNSQKNVWKMHQINIADGV